MHEKLRQKCDFSSKNLFSGVRQKKMSETIFSKINMFFSESLGVLRICKKKRWGFFVKNCGSYGVLKFSTFSQKNVSGWLPEGSGRPPNLILEVFRPPLGLLFAPRFPQHGKVRFSVGFRVPRAAGASGQAVGQGSAH